MLTHLIALRLTLVLHLLYYTTTHFILNFETKIDLNIPSTGSQKVCKFSIFLCCFSVLTESRQSEYHWNERSYREPKLEPTGFHWHHTLITSEVLDQLKSLGPKTESQWTSDGGVHNWWWKNLFESSLSKYLNKPNKGKPFRPTKVLTKPSFNMGIKNELRG